MNVYEVKSSRADFWSDVNAGKYRRYLPYCNRLYFVCPAGLVKLSEVPQGCGLITRQPHGGFRAVKPAVPREVETPSFDWMVDLLDRTWFVDAAAVRKLRERLTWLDNEKVRVQAHRVAEDVREAIYAFEVANRDGGVTTIEARNALYLSGKLIELAKAAGIAHRWGLGDERVTEDDLSYLAEHAVKLLRAADQVQAIGRYLAHLNLHELDRLGPDVVGGGVVSV